MLGNSKAIEGDQGEGVGQVASDILRRGGGVELRYHKLFLIKNFYFDFNP